MIYELRGDTIGTWHEAELVSDTAGERRLRLTGVRALGGADDRFMLKRVATATEGTETEELRFALCEISGDPLNLNLVARADSWDGHGSGPSHVVFDCDRGGENYVLDLKGLPRLQAVRDYGAAGPQTDAPGAGADDLPAACFAQGTRILTGRGRERVEALAAGDGVWTIDHGKCRVRWTRPIHQRFRGASDPRRPIRFDPGSLSMDLPMEPLWLPPGHGVLVTGWRAELFFGLPEVLVPAEQLVEWRGIERDTGIEAMTWHCLLLDTHEIVNAAGLMCETLSPGAALRVAPTKRERSDICRAVPTLRILGGRLSGQPVRPVAAPAAGSTVYLDTCLV